MKAIDLGAVDLNLLVAFESLYRYQSVTLAAQRIHIGQPAMSAALRRLRSLFDDALFVRVGREMKPTARAVAIAPQVLSALDTIRATLADLQTFNPASSQQTFTVATSDYFASMVLPALLGLLSQQAPQVKLRLLPVEKESLVEAIEKDTLDVAVGTFANLPPYILQQTLLSEQFVGLARRGHPALEDGVMSLENFVGFPHALFTSRRDDTGIIDQALAKQKLNRRIALTVPYWFALPSAIASSDLLVAIPSCLAAQVTQHYALQAFDLPLNLASWSITMVWSTLNDQNPENLWLRQTMQHACQSLVEARKTKA
ncbi:LysR family transcriptional regulator [Phormidium sp. FACHB-592]|uniref:LysR family transcriptional regulator n=1 Tax=Stenomitos frigidus AS-A4 TaxID=2933935 RepID=A0ABV0KQ89_9CYAN|nr:LysR family transcriptional regulator [Phormidium sp. FACHB-592]MBD2075439.1 LysR family transcriptional regulator [Phormidium sp. FACHB-592]